MADENRMITFNYARNNYDDYKRYTIPSSNEAMTKEEINLYLRADPIPLSNYTNNQLVPRSSFKGYLPIFVYVPNVQTHGVGGYSTYSQAITVKMYDFSGVRIYFNKSISQMQTIISQMQSENYGILNQKALIFLDSYNIKAARKIRLKHYKTANSTPVYPNLSSSTLKISPYTQTIHGIGGKFVQGSRESTVEVDSTLLLTVPTTITGDFYDYMEMHAYSYGVVSAANSYNSSIFSILIEIMDSNDNILEFNDPIGGTTSYYGAIRVGGDNSL